MTKLSDNLLDSVRKKAVGYTSSESVEEYVVSDGQMQLQKRKVTQKEVPPDISAAKLLLEMSEQDPYAQMSEQELEEEKLRLIGQLKEKNK